MLAVLLILGFFIDQTSIMMITLPFYMPLLRNMGVDLVWFGILYLLCMQIGLLTPPFGLLLFVLKGVAPPGITHRHDLSRRDPLCLADHPDDGADLRHSRRSSLHLCRTVTTTRLAPMKAPCVSLSASRTTSTRRWRCSATTPAMRRSWPAAKA